MSRKERLFPKYNSKQEQIPTLTKSLEGKELSTRETRAFLAAEAMNLSAEDTIILFGADIYIRSGTPRAEELIGVTPSQSVGMRDKVRTNEKYMSLWEKFEIVQRPYFAEVALGRRQGTPQKLIAEDLKISINQVSEISKYLIAVGIIQMSPYGRGTARKFRELVDKVEKADFSRVEGEPRPTMQELAERFGVSIYRIELARKRIRIKNQEGVLSHRLSKKPTYEETEKRKEIVLEGIRKGLTNRQISDQYEIPLASVRYCRKIIIEEGRVSKVESSRASNKEKLRLIINKHMEENPPGAIFNLSEVQRNWGEPISGYTVWSLFRELAVEQTVPPIRKQRKTLMKSFGRRKNATSEQIMAMRILDSMRHLRHNEIKVFFFHFLWQESNSLAQIKEFEDIREDITSVLDSVIYDDRLVDEYTKFYHAYQRKRLKELIRKGRFIGDASEEFEIDQDEIEEIRKEIALERKMKSR